jgi:hypothetical protein
MGKLVGLAEVAEYLGLVSRGKWPGNRLWEVLRAGRLKEFPHTRIGRFNMTDVEGLGEAASGGHGRESTILLGQLGPEATIFRSVRHGFIDS